MTRRDRAREREEREVLAAMEALEASNLRRVSAEEEARFRAVIADYMTRQAQARNDESDDDSDAEGIVDCNHVYEEDDHLVLDEEEQEDLPLLDADPLPPQAPGKHRP